MSGEDSDDENPNQLQSLDQDVIRLVSKYHTHLFRYILTLVPNETDAHDILQETCVDLVNRAKEYDPGREFLPWAYRFAYFEVLNFKKHRGRSKLVFDNDIVELLASDFAEGDESVLEAQITALDDCLELLPEKDRELVEIRYFQPTALEDFVSTMSISRRSIFRQLSRIRQLLLDCINEKVSENSPSSS